MLALSAIASPNWIVGKPDAVVIRNRTVPYRDSLGLYNRCGFRRFKERYEKRCYVYAQKFGEIAHPSWKASIIFLAVAILLLGVASLFGVVSLCKQLVSRKSLVNLAGTLQAFAGILLIFVLVVYPVGWSTNRIQRLCRHNNTYEIPKAYSIGDCSLGSAYYCAIAAALTAFICSLLSFPADKAVFADKVQDEILEGKQMICTL